MMTQEFMFELYLHSHNDDTTDYSPNETRWGFVSDTAARWYAIDLMQKMAEEGHDTSEMWCAFYRDSNNWTEDSKEFCIYYGMDYDEIEEEVEALVEKSKQPADRKEGATNE